jgi:hypothetical protein
VLRSIIPTIFCLSYVAYLSKNNDNKNKNSVEFLKTNNNKEKLLITIMKIYQKTSAFVNKERFHGCIIVQLW